MKNIIKRILRNIVKRIPICNVVAKVYTIAPDKILDGKNILITGGGRGLGFTVAQRAVNEGANVVIVGRDEATLAKACQEVGGNCQYIVCDVRDVNQFSDILNKATKMVDGAKIDCLVSNAGISLHEGQFRNVTENGWDRQFDTNLKGNYFLVKEFIQYLENQPDSKGNIVVISSERSKRADDIPYGLTKVATNAFVQGFAARVIEKGIRINAVAPGVTASDMTGYSAEGNLYSEHQPTKRVFIPEEVAQVVCFLLCDASNCISGEIIACDQGRYIAYW